MLDKLLNDVKSDGVTEDELEIVVQFADEMPASGAVARTDVAEDELELSAPPEPKAVPSTTTVDTNVVTNEMPPDVDVRVDAMLAFEDGGKGNDVDVELEMLKAGLLRPIANVLAAEIEVL
ncbi:hypothetical protein Tdes44962_MAKER09644 [Teratosphaeria destructans]|uniref:Uncharacterized protein n=1 Tax=Teratosphaeria destructans TaxID=418781 RepID=A0A9W7W2D2_9PEZI|nr:hypothetical protein Tdes44962_MAKER09644 [Teratosphaeria destructans]